MSLIVLLGIMGGLQSNLKNRSKKIVGDYVVYVDLTNEQVTDTIKKLSDSHIDFRIENQHEGLIQYGTKSLPVILHGLYKSTDEFNTESGAIFPYDILSLLRATPGNNLEFFSPSYVDSFFSDLPRSFSISIDQVVSTRVPEIDSSHVWLKANALNNFMRKIYANRIVLFSSLSKEKVHQNLANIIDDLKIEDIKSWDELHTSLVWALALEKIMMTFLFCGMCFLVCLSISSAVLVFIKKVNKDLTAMWVLGTSKDKIYKTSKLTLLKICLGSIIFGVFIGTLVLVLLDNYSGEIMPEVFVERKIPVQYSLTMYLIAIVVPSLLSFIFIHFGLNEFKNETDYLKNVRSIGQV